MFGKPGLRVVSICAGNDFGGWRGRLGAHFEPGFRPRLIARGTNEQGEQSKEDRMTGEWGVRTGAFRRCIYIRINDQDQIGCGYRCGKGLMTADTILIEKKEDALEILSLATLALLLAILCANAAHLEREKARKRVRDVIARVEGG